MIELHDIDLADGEVVTLSNGVKLIGSDLNGSRPGAIKIRAESGEIEIADFAQGRFSSEASRLVPTCEVAIWNGNAFIVGLLSVTIAGGGLPLKWDLFRKDGEDTGFYRTEWLEAGQRLFCIYESGIVALNEVGQVLWHIRKSWDDVFMCAEAEGLLFVMYDGQKFIIDQSDGSQRPPSTSPPSAPRD